MTVFICGLVACVRCWYISTAGRCKSDASMKNKTVLVTGATSGIGKAAAKDLAARGARVIMGCRNLVKAEAVKKEIIEKTGNTQVIFRHVDMADTTSVRKFASEVIQSEPKLHVLINNAGINAPFTKHVTKEKTELTMATNYLGHFLLTHLLLELLEKTSSSRIINVSSAAHQFVWNFNPKDINFDSQCYTPFQAYGLSKLCNILFTVELSRRLKDTGVTVNSMHPGVVATNFFTNSFECVSKVTECFGKLLFKDSELGAQTIIYLAVDPDLEETSGKYFVDCKEKTPWLFGRGRESTLRQFWQTSELMTKMTDQEKIDE